MESNNQAPEVPLNSVDVELMKDLVGVFRDAKCALTEDSAMAVVAIRRESVILSVFEEFLLTGQLEAEGQPDVSDETRFSVDNYLFRGTSKFTGALTSEKVTRG